MGIIKLGIMLFVVWLIASAFVDWNRRMSYYREGCDMHACVASGLGYVSQHEIDVERDSRKRNSKNLCPAWRDASWFGRNVTYRDLSWCADYIERL